VRAAMAERAAATQYGGHDLPDYQEAAETAGGEFDIRPSTSRSGEGTPMSDEPRDDSGEAATVDDYQQAESVSIGDEVDEDDEDDDVILVEVDDVSETPLLSLPSLNFVLVRPHEPLNRPSLFVGQMVSKASFICFSLFIC